MYLEKILTAIKTAWGHEVAGSTPAHRVKDGYSKPKVKFVCKTKNRFKS